MSARSSQKRSTRTSIERVLEEVNNQDSDYEEDTNKSDLYVVERILGRKTYKGVLKYKVKWEGYPESQCTWEPVDHLNNVPDLIEAFEKLRKTGKSRGREDKENDPNEPAEAKPKKQRQRTKKVKTDTVATKPKKDSDIKLKKREPEKEDKPADKPEEKKIVDDISEENSEGKLEQSLPVYGHFKYGDQAKRIAYARQEKDTVIFTIEWEPRKNGDTPMNSEVTGMEIRGYEKDMLLDFYEKRIKFVRSSTKVKQEHVEEQHNNYIKTPQSKGQIEEEFERSGEKDKQNKKSVEKQQAEVDNKGSVRKLFETAQKEMLESGKRVKVNASVGKRSVATTRFDDDGFFSEFGTPGNFREALEQEIATGNHL